MKSWLKIMIALLLLGIIAAIIVYFFVYNKPHPDFEKAKPEFTINASGLYQAFRTDPDAAAQKFNGKVIQLQGALDNIETGNDMVILTFTFEDGVFGPEGIRCTLLPQFHEAAMELVPGEIVDIKGFCTGFTGSDVILEKCSLIE